MNTDSYTPQTQEEHDAEQAWRQSVIDDMRAHERAWTRQGKCFAWIDTEPTYTPKADLSLLLIGKDGKELFPDPPTPYSRKLVFSLLGGGAIYTITPYVYVPEEWEKKGLGPTRSTGTYLQVYASPEEGDSDVAIVGDIYKGPNYEMAAQAVVFPEGHQAVADRVAKTLALIDSDCANFFALLESVWVDVLHRELDSNHFAELLMLDPENPGDWPSFIGEPWTLASRRSARRKTLLGE